MNLLGCRVNSNRKVFFGIVETEPGPFFLYEVVEIEPGPFFEKKRRITTLLLVTPQLFHLNFRHN